MDFITECSWTVEDLGSVLEYNNISGLVSYVVVISAVVIFNGQKARIPLIESCGI